MQKLIEYANQIIGLEISDDQALQFDAYFHLLCEYNEKFNLTSITDKNEIIIKHFLDSLSCLLVINQRGYFSLIDIGTGAGFPGIPIKIMRPDITLVLVESVGKKQDFCSLVIEKLFLKNSMVMKIRVEEIGQDPEHREKYDWVTARAVAELPVLTEYLLPLAKIGGHVLAMKGKSVKSEMQAAQNSIELLGGELTQIRELELPEGFGERILLVFEKKQPSPKRFPRRVGLPSKKPLK